MTWSSEPAAASSMVVHGDGYVGESCHRAGGAGELALGPEDRYVAVTSLAEPVEHDTALGAIRVWSGQGAELSIE